MPAVFVRLAGCNLACEWCDTDYTSTRKLYKAEDLYDRVRFVSQSGKLKLVVITGGEPFRQNISPFVKMLLKDCIRVQIETNGTLYLDDLPYLRNRFSIVCSPKTPKINPSLEEFVSAWKYILDADNIDPVDGLPTHSMGALCSIARPSFVFSRVEVYVQPLDEKDEVKNKRNAQACVESCLKHGYRLSIQGHKILGLE